MANKLNSLIPFLLMSAQEVSRELVGAIPACFTNMTADSVAKDQVVKVPITPEAPVQDLTIGTAPIVTGDKFTDIEVRMTKFRVASMLWNGEEELAVKGVLSELKRNQITQRMRVLVNEMEIDVALEAATGAQGGVYGSPGTTPFVSSDMKDMAQLVKVFNDIGAPQTGRQFVGNTSALANLRNHGVLYRANEAGTTDLLRNGVLGNLYGFEIRESAGFRPFVPTGNGYKVNTTPEAGAREVQIDTGTGPIKKGSVVTFAGDATKYIVTEGFAGTAGLLKIGPALKIAPAVGAAITVCNEFLPCAAFTRDAIVLATRAPAMPEGGDAADDVETVTDPVSGLTFLVASYPGFMQRRLDISIVWGVKTVNPQHSVLVLG
jgi:hypothetical protein